jgi:hypothetical protein
MPGWPHQVARPARLLLESGQRAVRLKRQVVRVALETHLEADLVAAVGDDGRRVVVRAVKRRAARCGAVGVGDRLTTGITSWWKESVVKTIPALFASVSTRWQLLVSEVSP